VGDIVLRTHLEIVEALATQRRHLATSSAKYDAGDKSEAVRLATCVCNLVHDAGKTRSILSQLGLKTKIRFMASGHEVTDEIRRIASRFTPLIELERHPKGGGPPEFVPVSIFFKARGMHPFLRELPFAEWWENDLIFFEGGGLPRRELTRKRLVFTLRNQEGGSHFDAEMRDRDYLSLREPVPFVVPGAGLGDMRDLELATMRQIAEELELSIRIYAWQKRIRGVSSKPAAPSPPSLQNGA
jgi:hypothetical protein